jgi:hypothetical protein
VDFTLSVVKAYRRPRAGGHQHADLARATEPPRVQPTVTRGGENRGTNVAGCPYSQDPGDERPAGRDGVARGSEEVIIEVGGREKCLQSLQRWLDVGSYP